MKYIYTATFTPSDDGNKFYARVPDLPGCITTGSDLIDAINQITDAASAWLVVAEDEGMQIPDPTPQDLADLWRRDYSRRLFICLSLAVHSRSVFVFISFTSNVNRITSDTSNM